MACLVKLLSNSSRTVSFSLTDLTHSNPKSLFFADGLSYYQTVCNDSTIRLAAPASSEPPIPRKRDYLTLKMEALRSFETSGTTRPKPLRHIPEDLNICCHTPLVPFLSKSLSLLWRHVLLFPLQPTEGTLEAKSSQSPVR